MAAKHGFIEMASILIDHGAEVDHETPRGMTALIEAARHNQGEMVTMLLQRGAVLHRKNKHRLTALDWALRYKHRVLAEDLNLLMTVARKQPMLMTAINT